MLLRNDVGQGPIRRELAFHASERYRCDRPVGSKGDNWSDASVLLDRCEECRPITVAHAEPRRRPKRGHNGEGRSDGRCYGFHRAIRSNDVRHPIDDHEFPIETVYGANSEIAVTQFAYPQSIKAANYAPHIAPTGPIRAALDFRARCPDGRMGW